MTDTTAINLAPAVEESIERSYSRIFRGEGDRTDGLLVLRDIMFMAAMGKHVPIIPEEGANLAQTALMRAGAQDLAHRILRKAGVVVQLAAREPEKPRQRFADDRPRQQYADETPHGGPPLEGR